MTTNNEDTKPLDQFDNGALLAVILDQFQVIMDDAPSQTAPEHEYAQLGYDATAILAARESFDNIKNLNK